MTFGELKKAVAEAEHNGLSDHAPVFVVDAEASGDQFHISEALDDTVHTTDDKGNSVAVPVFWIGIQLIMEPGFKN